MNNYNVGDGGVEVWGLFGMRIEMPILMTANKMCHYFQISGPLLDESQVRSIVDEIKQVITASSSRKREREERAKAEDFDAEEGELLREENEQEEEVFDQVNYLTTFSVST